MSGLIGGKMNDRIMVLFGFDGGGCDRDRC